MSDDSNQKSAHVIRCNDSVEAVFIGSAEGAEKAMQEIQKDDFEKRRKYLGQHEAERLAELLHWRTTEVPLYQEDSGGQVKT